MHFLGKRQPVVGNTIQRAQVEQKLKQVAYAWLKQIPSHCGILTEGQGTKASYKQTERDGKTRLHLSHRPNPIERINCCLFKVQEQIVWF